MKNLKISSSLILIALVLGFITLLYYVEVSPVYANPATTPTAIPFVLTITPTTVPPPVPANTNGIVIWGVIIVLVILAGLVLPRFTSGKTTPPADLK